MTNVEKTGNELKNVVIVRGGGDLGQRYDPQTVPLRIPPAGT